MKGVGEGGAELAANSAQWVPRGRHGSHPCLPKLQTAYLPSAKGRFPFCKLMGWRREATNHSNLGLTAMLGVAPGGASGESVRSQGTLEPTLLSFESCQCLEQVTLLGSGESIARSFVSANNAEVAWLWISGVSLLGHF